MRIVTWNVNSIKMRQSHADKLLAEVQPDIVMLQETKCENHNFPTLPGYYKYCSGQKSYNGVAILTKNDVVCIVNTLDGYNYEEARYLEVELNDTIFIDVYVPFGQEIGSTKYGQKIEFLTALANRLIKLRGKKIVVGGDFNVAVDPIDIYCNLHDSVCYALELRNMIRGILNSGYYDPFRALNPTMRKFSWWDYRNNAYVRNFGMRLDYFLISPHIMDSATSCSILDAYRALESPSDHVPILLELSS